MGYQPMDIPSLESDDTYRFTQELAAYKSRSEAAFAAYRAIERPSNFRPAPPAPGADPEPSSESVGTPSLESVKVSFYDALTRQKLELTGTHLGTYRRALNDFANYIRANVDPSYAIPESDVVTPTIVIDGNSSLESNATHVYDQLLSDLMDITDRSMAKVSVEKTSYEQKMTSANQKFNALKTGSNSISKRYERIGTSFNDMFRDTRRQQKVDDYVNAYKRMQQATDEATKRQRKAIADDILASMSVWEATQASCRLMKDDFNEHYADFNTNEIERVFGDGAPSSTKKGTIVDGIEDMVDGVAAGLKDVSEIE